MRRILNHRFWREQRGTESLEWALIAGMLVGGLILVLGVIGLWIKQRFESIQTDMGI